MKNVIQLWFWLFLFSFSLPADAQESELERGSLHPGFIISLQGDTVKGYLLNINLWLNQHMTFFYKDPEDFKERIKYKPDEIKAYQVGNRYYESMKYPFTLSPHKQNFILRKLHGPINLYVWYYDEDKAKLISPDISLVDLTKAILFEERDLWTNDFGMKANGEFTELTGFKFLMKFAKNMSAYVADDVELADKILKKAQGYQGISRDIENIIREYNARKLK
jgi:hypothetical protein